MDKKHEILKKYFGHSSFRTGQELIIDKLLSGSDALGIMPTGAGKSVCYQIPALIFSGITIVISPLISLMNDQVSSLVQAGISAAYLNSSLTAQQYGRVLYNIEAGKYKIIYVAPERLLTNNFISICQRINISMVAVDEAHCVSQWGQDFRPSYLKIVEFINSLVKRPIVGAFTATATRSVRDDILKILRLNDPFVITSGFDRPNLYFSVIRTKKKNDKLLELLEERRESAGIVYCATRKCVEEVCELLTVNGFKAARYHAGLTDNERRCSQEDFVYDRKSVMVATNAFGMGIDKSNVSFVIHYNMPKNIESYYQEAGRAGRDGEEAECFLLYSPADVRTNQFLIENSEPNPELSREQQENIKNIEYARLKYMTYYCTTNDCLRNFILKYFGEKQKSYCGKCSNCLTQYETVDATTDAQKILSCIIRTGQKYGKKMICDVLRGSKNEKITRLGLDNQSTYGIMSETGETNIRNIIMCLEEQGYIISTAGEYPVLKVSPKCSEILKGNIEFQIKTVKERRKPDKQNIVADTTVDDGLFNKLKLLRRELAEAAKVPAYIIFSNSALTDMCKKKPLTKDEFLNVSGVGNKKAELYGDKFLKLIREHTESTGE